MKSTISVIMIAVLMLSKTVIAQSWVQQTSGTDSSLFDVHFIDPNNGFACGVGGMVLKTTNGGINWNPLSTGFTDGFQIVRFLNADTGFVCGTTNGILLKTTNGGSSWNDIGPTLPDHSNGGMWFTSIDTGCIAIGSGYSNSKILKTHNGGVTWDTVYAGVNWISYMNFSDAYHGWATASGGTILKTTDGGNNWTVLQLGDNYWMSGVYFFDPNDGLVGGGFQTTGTFPIIWKTTDSGNNWLPVFAQSSSVWIGVSKIGFAEINIGYAINAVSTGAGSLLKTTNGGTTWAVEVTPKKNLRGLFFTDTTNGYAVGDGGTILKYSGTTDAVHLPTSYPTAFALEQNYPNPFNPSTSIEYSLPKDSRVEIEVFDMLGRQVKTLVNEEKTSGTYKVRFNATSLSSGVYFYRMSSDNFFGIKKLVLIK
ncbi:MAG: YCF48-related protein [Bacteroidota bacterium]